MLPLCQIPALDPSKYLALKIVDRLLAAFGSAAFSYIALTLLTVVNLLWDAFDAFGLPSASIWRRRRICRAS